MGDTDLEPLLRRYRPAAPRSDLRDRVLATETPRTWPWVAAAAALVVIVMGTGSASTAVITRADVVAPATAPYVHAADDLAELLGGGDGARLLALGVIAEERWRAEQAAQAAAAPAFAGAVP